MDVLLTLREGDHASPYSHAGSSRASRDGLKEPASGDAIASSRIRPTLPRRLPAVATAVLMSGCSIASVQRPRPAAAIEDPRVPDTCTSTVRAPVADTVMGAAVLALGYGLLALDAGMRGAGTRGPGLVTIGVGAAYAGSATYGYVSTAQCRRRVAANGRCANGDLVACHKVKPGW